MTPLTEIQGTPLNWEIDQEEGQGGRRVLSGGVVFGKLSYIYHFKDFNVCLRKHFKHFEEKKM